MLPDVIYNKCIYANKRKVNQFYFLYSLNSISLVTCTIYVKRTWRLREGRPEISRRPASPDRFFFTELWKASAVWQPDTILGATGRCPKPRASVQYKLFDVRPKCLLHLGFTELPLCNRYHNNICKSIINYTYACR